MKVSPPPIRDVVVNLSTKSGLVTRLWLDWFTHVWNRLGTVADRVGGESLTTQGAAITTTDIPTLALTTGLYRVSYYARVTRAATTSSSLTVTIGWTDDAVACSQAGAAMVGNTTATQQNDSFIVHVDGATTISYAAAYASVGATSMQFRLDVSVESLP